MPTAKKKPAKKPEPKPKAADTGKTLLVVTIRQEPSFIQAESKGLVEIKDTGTLARIAVILEDLVTNIKMRVL